MWEMLPVDGVTWPRADTVLIALDGRPASDDLADLRFRLHRSLLDGARTVIIDVSAVDALPSALIGAMLIAHRSCRRRGGRVVLRDPGPRTLSQLERTGLTHVLHVECVATVALCPGPTTS